MSLKEGKNCTNLSDKIEIILNIEYCMKKFNLKLNLANFTHFHQIANLLRTNDQSKRLNL